MKKAQDGKTVTNVDVANNNVIKKFADDKAARQAAHEARNAEFNSMMATADNSIQSTIDSSNTRYAKKEVVAKKQFGGTYPTQPTAAVINDYSKKKPYGQPGGPSFMATTPAPTLKKGGSVKKKK